MAKFTAKTPIDHDGESYAIGDPIELDSKSAGQLRAINAIGDASTKTDPVELTEDQIIEAIQSVISNLVEDDFTQSGAPKVRAVEGLLKDKVDPALITTDLVKQAWETIKETSE